MCVANKVTGECTLCFLPWGSRRIHTSWIMLCWGHNMLNKPWNSPPMGESSHTSAMPSHKNLLATTFLRCFKPITCVHSFPVTDHAEEHNYGMCWYLLPKTLLIPQHPWSHLVMGFLLDLTHSHSNTTIKAVIDQFLKCIYKMWLQDIYALNHWPF